MSNPFASPRAEDKLPPVEREPPPPGDPLRPRFSLRFLLIATAGIAFLLALLGAMRLSPAAVLGAFAFTILTTLVSIGLIHVVWLIADAIRRP